MVQEFWNIRRGMLAVAIHGQRPSETPRAQTMQSGRKRRSFPARLLVPEDVRSGVRRRPIGSVTRTVIDHDHCRKARSNLGHHLGNGCNLI